MPCLSSARHSVFADRARLRHLAESQSALRRVATLVARGLSPQRAFGTVAGELGALIGADYTAVNRYEPEETVAMVGFWADPGAPEILFPPGKRWAMGSDTPAALIRRTGQVSRVSTSAVTAEIGAWARSQGVNHIVSCPIWVEGSLWGVLAAMFRGERQPPADTEARLRDFVELTACALAQAKSRADLMESRSRVLAASDATRRRIERDLHDGVQQHLVSIGFDLRNAEYDVPPELGELRSELEHIEENVSAVLTELQDIARGLHPAVLSRSGLHAALEGLARRSAVPVDLHDDYHAPLPEHVEVTLYYIVCEALTNVLKHAAATSVVVDLDQEDGERLSLTIHDDGVGGADPDGGSGLLGLRDRVEALGGTLRLTSPPGTGTTLRIVLPHRVLS